MGIRRQKLMMLSCQTLTIALTKVVVVVAMAPRVVQEEAHHLVGHCHNHDQMEAIQKLIYRQQNISVGRYSNGAGGLAHSKRSTPEPKSSRQPYSRISRTSSAKGS